MRSKYYIPAGSAAAPYTVDISPESAGWTESSLQVLELGVAGFGEVTRTTGDTEVMILSLAGIPLSGFASGLLALCLQNGGYVAEIYRGGLQSVSPRQYEAGRALGMRRWTLYRSVILPQVIARVIPPPVDVPKMPTFFAVVVFSTARYTAIASSIAAGYGKSGGIR